MSIYQEFNSDWQRDWSKKFLSGKLDDKGDYTSRRIRFMNEKLEELKQSDPRKFSQYCSDFYSVQNTNKQKWGIINAAVLGVGIGLTAAALFGVATFTPLFVGALATVVVAKTFTFVKLRHYKLSTALIKILRGDTDRIRYFKFFKRAEKTSQAEGENKEEKETHYNSLTREELLKHKDYPMLLKTAQIPPALEEEYKEIYKNNTSVISFGPAPLSEEHKPNQHGSEQTSEESKAQKKDAWYKKYLPEPQTEETHVEKYSIPLYYPKVFSDKDPEIIK